MARLTLQNLAQRTTRRISIGTGIFSHRKDSKFRSNLSRLSWNKASIAKTTIWRSERRSSGIQTIQYKFKAFLARSLRDQCVAIIYREKFTAAMETWCGYIFTVTAMRLPHTRDSRLLLYQVGTALGCCMTERIGKRGRNTPPTILHLKRSWTGMKIANVANDQFCIPLCNNNKCYDSGKDLSYFHFPRDNEKRKRTPSLEYGICLKYILYARRASFKIQTGGCVIRWYGGEVLRTFHDY